MERCPTLTTTLGTWRRTSSALTSHGADAASWGLMPVFHSPKPGTPGITVPRPSLESILQETPKKREVCEPRQRQDDRTQLRFSSQKRQPPYVVREGGTQECEARPGDQ